MTKHRLSIEEWNLIKKDYYYGNSVERIAYAWDISRDTIYKKIRKENWKRGLLYRFLSIFERRKVKTL